MKNYNTMLHMKLNSAVSVFSIAAAFAVFLPPSNASAGICFLPDCMDSDLVQGDINMNINEDSEFCESKGYTYYSSGECPQYQAKIGTCSRDEHYLKCDAVKWCKDNGYNTQTCSLPSFVNGQCPNGKPYYKGCKEDRPRACREQGYVNSCSPGRLYATSNRCPWDSSYGKCCTASPSAGCPTDYKVTCDPSRGSSGVDTCGYTCYRCCDDTCPSGTSKNYTGSYSTTTECGSRCNRCKSCPSGSSTSYTGSYAGTTECNGGQSCYKCNDTCRSGQKSVSCSSTYKRVKVSTTECGTGCYQCQYNTDCNVTSKSCSYGCASYNSCNKCTSCKSAPACNHSTHVSCSNGCATYCPCCSSCKTCKSSSSTPSTPSHSHSYSCPSGYSTSSSGCSNGYTTTSKTCSCGAKSGTCYKCEKVTAPSCTYSTKCPGYNMVSCTNGVEDSCTACGTTKYKCHHHTYSCPSGYSTSSSGCSNGYTTTSKTCSCGAKSGTCYKCNSAPSGPIMKQCSFTYTCSEEGICPNAHGSPCSEGDRCYELGGSQEINCNSSGTSATVTCRYEATSC